MALRLTGFPEPSDVKMQHTWRSDFVPDLGMDEDVRHKFRIYIIECPNGNLKSDHFPLRFVSIDFMRIVCIHVGLALSVDRVPNLPSQPMP